VLPVISPWIEKWAQELAHSPAPIIGFTMLTTSKRCTLQVIKRLRELSPSKFIVVGGPHVTRYEGGPEVLADPNVDVVVPGEGEEIFFELVKSHLENQPIDQIPGLMFKRDGQTVDTGERKLIQSISELPFPEFAGFDLHNYRSLTLPILGSRGCIYKCAFCSETVLWRRFRFRTGENLFQEFKKHSEELGVKSFLYCRFTHQRKH
jgi:anaerobic magnesium-protoporphyrin IX monomethyl ester cyclase